MFIIIFIVNYARIKGRQFSLNILPLKFMTANLTSGNLRASKTNEGNQGCGVTSVGAEIGMIMPLHPVRNLSRQAQNIRTAIPDRKDARWCCETCAASSIPLVVDSILWLVRMFGTIPWKRSSVPNMTIKREDSEKDTTY